MRGLNPEDIDQLITITGMVIRTSQLIPEMTEGEEMIVTCMNEGQDNKGHVQGIFRPFSGEHPPPP